MGIFLFKDRVKTESLTPAEESLFSLNEAINEVNATLADIYNLLTDLQMNISLGEFSSKPSSVGAGEYISQAAIAKRKPPRRLQDARKSSLNISYKDLKNGSLGRMISSSLIESENNHTNFKSDAYRLLASQALDLFRDGKTLGQIRLMQPRYGVEDGEISRRPFYLGEGAIVSRVVKAIFKFGTPEEIDMLQGEKK
jgi:hypothetical protein